jgi:sulfur relay (sulfurtransferase) DsrC/TusE family protein
MIAPTHDIGAIAMYNINQNQFHQENKIDFVVDGYGFLINPEEWTEVFAEKVLGLLPGELTAEHLRVIHFVKYKVQTLGTLPLMRHVCKSTGLEKSALKNLFGTCLQLWKAAGLPRPDDEIRSHMN